MKAYVAVDETGSRPIVPSNLGIKQLGSGEKRSSIRAPTARPVEFGFSGPRDISQLDRPKTSTKNWNGRKLGQSRWTRDRKLDEPKSNLPEVLASRAPRFHLVKRYFDPSIGAN